MSITGLFNNLVDVYRPTYVTGEYGNVSETLSLFSSGIKCYLTALGGNKPVYAGKLQVLATHRLFVLPQSDLKSNDKIYVPNYEDWYNVLFIDRCSHIQNHWEVLLEVIEQQVITEEDLVSSSSSSSSEEYSSSSSSEGNSSSSSSESSVADDVLTVTGSASPSPNGVYTYDDSIPGTDVWLLGVTYAISLNANPAIGWEIVSLSNPNDFWYSGDNSARPYDGVYNPNPVSGPTGTATVSVST